MRNKLIAAGLIHREDLLVAKGSRLGWGSADEFALSPLLDTFGNLLADGLENRMHVLLTRILLLGLIARHWIWFWRRPSHSLDIAFQDAAMRAGAVQLVEIDAMLLGEALCER